jgi:8-oxo-dGTP pyrophosphatase MutT (NUDIX family)
VITLEQVRRELRSYQPVEVNAPEALPAAVALILYEGTGGGGGGVEALFIKRAQQAGDPWSGQIALPGGRREPADADLLATAVRETREETGIELTGVEQLGALDDLYPRTPTLPPVVVRPYVFVVGARPALVPDVEVERAFWVPLRRLGEPGVRRELTLTIRGVERTFPAYQLGDDVLWGMTERIITPFVDLVSRGARGG